MIEIREEQVIARFSYYFKGDRDAVSFALMVTDIADVWDDLIDKDVEVQPEAINRAMIIALSSIPRNPFYRRHQDELLPLIECSILNWLSSNELSKRGGQVDLEIANVLRNSVVNLFVHMARLIGGVSWAATVAPDLYVLAQDGNLSEFAKEHSNG